MDTLYILLDKFLASIGPFFLLLGLLIFVHELGHFLVAKLCGIRVETFSLGFGKKILKFTKGDTTYAISLIPLGGYVKMFGDDPTKEVSEEEKKYSFLHKPVAQKIAVVLAGPLMNLFFAIALFGTIGLMGEPVPSAHLGDISEDSPAFASGFRSGDKILSINDKNVENWKQVKRLVEARPNQTLTFSVEREGSSEVTSIKAETQEIDNPFIFSTDRKIGWIDGLKTDSRAPVVALTSKDSPAGQAGIRTLDVIKKINGLEVSYWRELEPTLAKAVGQDGPLSFTVVNQMDETAEERVVELPAPADGGLASLGLTSTDLVLYSIKPSSPASEAELQPGDRIVSINGNQLSQWEELLETVKNWKADNAPMNLQVYRDGEVLEKTLAPEMTEIPTPQGQFEQRFAIGISPAILSMPNELITEKVSGIGSATVLGIEKSWEWSKLIVISMVRLVQNEVSARNIGGVISIGRVASQSYEIGWIAFIKMMGIISINLFLLNLLPVPVLDGGHLVFFTIEAIKGSPLSLRKMEMAQQVGLVLLLSLMVFSLFNDIRNLLTAW